MLKIVSYTSRLLQFDSLFAITRPHTISVLHGFIHSLFVKILYHTWGHMMVLSECDTVEIRF